MASGGSTRVVVLALLANAGIAVAKFVAAVVTGSGAMMAESVHSAADSGNQALLLLGHARARRPSDERHPFGYARESYFWALLVAIILFVLGGAFSLYEGVHKMTSGEPLTNAGWAVGVLVFGIFLEGYSLRAAWLEYGRVRGRRSLLRWSKSTGNVNLLVVVFEDLAATAGLVLALVAVLLSWATGNPFYDALGTCVIGVLLLVVAVFLAGLVRRLIIGLSISDELRAGIITIWNGHKYDVLDLYAIWHGPDAIIVAIKVRPRDARVEAATLMRELNEIENEVRASYPQVVYHFVEPDHLR
ncbi:MAG: cation diffusion facilitator family transporter [Planctomycetota bacterium]|nr:cation diffusion facilitator family transporter [Planctomycetota bacterium]